MFYYPPTADPGCDGVRGAGAELPLWFKVRPVMKLACVVVLQKLELHVVYAGSCSLWCQTSGVSEPKAGI